MGYTAKKKEKKEGEWVLRSLSSFLRSILRAFNEIKAKVLYTLWLHIPLALSLSRALPSLSVFVFPSAFLAQFFAHFQRVFFTFFQFFVNSLLFFFSLQFFLCTVFT